MARQESPRSVRRVTSNDVANAAGVSRATVSFVLNNTPHQSISEETRRRVRDAAAKLSYRPSAEARALRRGRSDVVLLCLPEQLPMSHELATFIEAMTAALAAKHLALMVNPWTPDPVVEAWRAVTPVIVIGWHLDPEAVEGMLLEGVQVVTSMIDEQSVFGRWVLGTREADIARTQVGCLAEAGHRRLAYALPTNDRLFGPGQLRRQSLERACAERGLPAPIPFQTAGDVDTAAQAVSDLLRDHPSVTGVCAHDDIAALAVLAGLQGTGRSAPADLAIVGVNDSPAAALANPPLTMVTVDTKASADYGVEVLVALLDGRDPPSSGPSAVGLIKRRSV